MEDPNITREEFADIILWLAFKQLYRNEDAEVHPLFSNLQEKVSKHIQKFDSSLKDVSSKLSTTSIIERLDRHPVFLTGKMYSPNKVRE